jgi:hypothetical protein
MMEWTPPTVLMSQGGGVEHHLRRRRRQAPRAERCEMCTVLTSAVHRLSRKGSVNSSLPMFRDLTHASIAILRTRVSPALLALSRTCSRCSCRTSIWHQWRIVLSQSFRYARKLTLSPARMTQADPAAVYEAGWGDDALYSAALVMAPFNFYNRLVDGVGLALPDGYVVEAAKWLSTQGYDVFAQLAKA